MKKLFITLAIASVAFISGCEKDEYQETVGVCPLVVSTVPIDKAVNVPLSQIITATFNEKMDPETITEASFLLKQGETSITGNVTYSGLTASLEPSVFLAPFTLYTGRVKTLAKDLMRNSLQTDYVWTFTTIPEVVLSSLPIAGGTTSGAGTFNQGSLVTVVATPNPGYSFANWTENGTAVSTNPSYQFTMAGNKALVANFTLQYVVNLLSNPVLGGTTSGSGSFNAGSNVTVTAFPNAEYNFVNWTEGTTIASTNAIYTFQLNASRTLVANYVLKTYTLNVTATNGTAVKNPSQLSYNSGTIVELTATPNTGYNFTSWSGDATGFINPLSVTMNANKNITANFAINTYTLNVTANNGTVVRNPNQATYNSGTTVQLTATPNAGYTFTSWSGDATGITNPLTVTMNANKSIVANFTLNTYTLNVTANNGTVVRNPNQATYNGGTTVQLTATPNAGYTFTSWSGDATGSTNPLTVTMNADKNITANFTLNVYTLNVIANNGTVVKNPNQATYDSGTTVQLTATPNAGYTFTSWSGDATGSTNPLTVTMNANKNITANFTLNTYTLNVIANNGTVLRNPDQPTYDNGTTVQLTAIPNVGYTFVSWSGDATGSTNPLTVTMNADKNITANFVINVYTLNVTATNGSVLKNPDQPTYNGGTTVQLTATPNSGYAFISWSGDATGSTNPLTVTMNADKNITANFAMTGPLAIDLTCAAPYAVMAGSTITSTGPSIINGDVALSPGSALVGFPPGVINGTQQITTPIAAAAKLCLTTAYIDGQGRSLNAISLPGQLGGLTLAPGLYSNSSTSGISGTGANGILTLDAQGNSNAVWIFQIGSTLTTDPATSIVLAGGAQAANIFWIVGTSATLGTTSVFYGNILADQSITLNTGAVLNGRALTRIAAVSLDASTITKP
ncbi:MAG TPA: hypothetical protein DIW50_05765 [Prolixibacteraceae bacterium]|nr:hypothetical protein [Prolixibacteraceae bacterium]